MQRRDFLRHVMVGAAACVGASALGVAAVNAHTPSAPVIRGEAMTLTAADFSTATLTAFPPMIQGTSVFAQGNMAYVHQDVGRVSSASVDLEQFPLGNSERHDALLAMTPLGRETLAPALSTGHTELRGIADDDGTITETYLLSHHRPIHVSDTGALVQTLP